MIWIKKHETDEGHLLLAACDEELLGQTLEDDEFQISCPESFFKGELVDQESVMRLLQQCMHANLVGKDIVAIAKDMDLVKDFKIIQDVPYAYVVKVAE